MGFAGARRQVENLVFKANPQPTYPSPNYATLYMHIPANTLRVFKCAALGNIPGIHTDTNTKTDKTCSHLKFVCVCVCVTHVCPSVCLSARLCKHMPDAVRYRRDDTEDLTMTTVPEGLLTRCPPNCRHVNLNPKP